MAGEVLEPGDGGYDEARKVWNGDIDRRPAVIARCVTVADVSAAVRHGVEHGLDIAVRGGAHSMSGQSVVDDGLMIDLSRLNAVSVDPDTRRARSSGGALLGDLIEATQQHGLALPVGAISHTGVGGLTLGGGMGWLTRKHGLTIDNLLSAEVVLADGRVVRTSTDEHPDLFWALRGGGGNFGVVTEFEFALHPVGPMIQFGMLFWGLEQGARRCALAREVIGSLPPGVNVILGALNAPPAPFVPQEHQLQPGYALWSPASKAATNTAVVERSAPRPPAVGGRDADAVRRAAADARRANAWGIHDYEKGLLPRRAHRRRHRGARSSTSRTRPRRCRSSSSTGWTPRTARRGGRDGVQRRPFAALRHLHHR